MKLSRSLRIQPGEVVALTGGGGKTSLMFRLAGELAQPGRFHVLTTTSTRIFAAQISLAPASVSFDPQQETLPDILPALDRALAEHGQVLLIGQADPDSGKAFGVPPETIDRLAESGRFQLVINEADGSRMRPFKAPAAHEPVIPACTTLVSPVVGLDVLDRPLNSESVHRPELVAQLSGTPPEQPITAETVAAVLCHPQGGLKNVPPAARIVPVINKVDGPSDLPPARDLAQHLLACPRIDAVVLAAARQADSPAREVHHRTAAVVLAAGGSSRFGSPKQLAPWQGRTFLEQVVQTALDAAIGPVIVVLGAEVEQCRRLLAGLPVQVVVNPRWAEGQSTSMQAGLEALPAGTGGAVFLLVDQPAVQADTVRRVVQAHRETLAPVVWPEYQGRRGNPVLFDRSLFPALRQIRGDTGGRPLLQAHAAQAARVPVEDRGVVLDFDTPEAL